MNDFSIQLSKRRKELNLTQLELANKLGLKNHNAVSNWEKGKAKPSADDLVRLAEILETTPNFLLLGGKDNKDSEIESLKRENELMKQALNAYQRAEKAEKELKETKNIEVVSNKA